MQGKNKIKLLILSVSVLILLIVAYAYTGSSSRTKSSESPTLAYSIKTGFEKVGSFTSDLFNNIQSKIELKKEEREAKKTAEEFLLTNSVPDVSAEDTSISLEEEDTSEERYVYNPETYLAPYEITIPEELAIPDTGDVEFRKVSDYVYACDEATLYKDAACSETVGKASLWQEFLRVGISEGCCYELISDSGELVFSDGSHFRRHREDMPTFESISLKGSIMLDLDYISQFPTLTNGSEVTSLATVLNYYGFDISKDDLANSYLPKGKVGKTNFYDAFVGDPTNRNSYGCYAGALVTAANTYFESEEGPDTELKAYDYTGSDFNDLLLKVKAGIPVIVYIAKDMEEEPEFTDEWIVDGEYLVWKDNIHCVVLMGYDSTAGQLIACDPTLGITEYDMDLFIKRFKQFYSQAVIIE